jgi:predicted MFS family arabinose efflux permease
MLADTVNRTRLISFGVTLWSALTAASGLAWNFVSMAIPRMFIGVGESILTPSAMSLLADRFPQSRLGFAAGFYYIGAPLGAGGSFLLAGYLGPIIGWRNCFYLLGGIGIVLAAIVFFVKETPRRHLVNSEDQKNTPSIKKIAKIAMTAIPKSPALMAAMAGAMLLHVFIGAGYFDQLWFVQERGFDRDEIAKLTGMMGLLGGLIGTFVGGVGSDWFTQKTGYGRLVFLFFVLLFCAPFMIAYRLAPGDSIWIPIGLFLGMFQIGSFFGPFFASIQGLIPPEVRSTVIAFSILLMNVIGMGIGITVTGISVDLMISYGINEPYSLTLICFTLFSFIAMPCFLFAGLRYNHDREKLNITESS